jgi:hypothetical protein
MRKASWFCKKTTYGVKIEKKNLKDIPIGIRAEEALKKAVADTIADHKRFGDSIVIWRDGKIVKIPADQIELREHQAEYESK